MPVPVLWRDCKTHRLLCVPTPPMFVYDSATFGDNAQRANGLSKETAITELFIMSIIFFIQTAEHEVTNSFCHIDYEL